MQERGCKELLERMFGGNGITSREDHVREYVVHRVRSGASLEKVLQKGYVKRNCDRDEIDGIVRDPRLIHEERETQKRFFKDGHLDPAHALRRR